MKVPVLTTSHTAKATELQCKFSSQAKELVVRLKEKHLKWQSDRLFV